MRWIWIGFVFLLSALGVAQSNPPVFSTTTSYQKGAEIQYAGNTFRALNAVSASSNLPTTDYNDWELYFVRADTTLMIGPSQTFPDIPTAWTYLLNATIADGAYVHMIVGAGGADTENLSGPLILNHRNGANISIVNNFGLVELQFPTGSAGIVISNGHKFGGIFGQTGLYILGTSGTYGVQVNQNSTLSHCDELVINGFGEGMEAGSNSSIYSVNPGLEGDGDGAEALYGGYISLTSLDIGPGDLTGAGLLTIGGQIAAVNSTIEGCATGAWAKDGGFIDVSGCTMTENNIGISSQYHSHVKAENAEISVSTTDDIIANGASTVDVIGADYTTTQVYGQAMVLTETSQ